MTRAKSHRGAVRPAAKDTAERPADLRAATPGSAFKAVKKLGRPANAMNRK
jgi:hypothetical protein